MPSIFTITGPKFPTGNIVATPGALDALKAAGVTPESLLLRHIQGDWGNLPIEDRQANDAALRTGNRLLSAYYIGNIKLTDPDMRKIWIITEWDRSITTLLLPDEY